MIVAVDITRTADGVTRRHTLHDVDREGARFMWTDGNYGCDCNRHLWFERAAGRDPHREPDWAAWNEREESRCGVTRYRAAFVHDDGTIQEICHAL